MEFRPCIDIHNGKVKQIVGGTLKDQNDQAAENFVSEQDAPFYAQLYKTYGISGGHIILLNARDSSYYEATKLQALAALQVSPLILVLEDIAAPLKLAPSWELLTETRL